MRTVEFIEALPTAKVRISPRNARTHPGKQIQQLVRSIKAFGFVNPVLVDERSELIAGHARLKAAQTIDLRSVPAIRISGLTDAQKRALCLADNRIAQNAGWDRELLALELGELLAFEDFDISLTGFEAPEIDQILLDHEGDATDPADDLPPPSKHAVSRTGDLWQLGQHRLLCGDARSEADPVRLCGGAKPTMCFTDPPYNVKVRGIVGRGRIKHSEFAMASGEMSEDEFAVFLEQTLAHAAKVSADGAVHFVCMDWRHIATLLAAGAKVYDQILNLVVWVKTNAGQGSFYRSQHELIGVFRVGSVPHRNNIELGRHGRSRSNVWHYPGANTFRRGRLDELASHPTVKPVGMIVDAMRDVTRRGDHVLDIFGGSGSTLLAAERIGRRALLMEIEGRFVDVAIRRWQAFTGKDAVHAETGRAFNDIAATAREAIP